MSIVMAGWTGRANAQVSAQAVAQMDDLPEAYRTLNQIRRAAGLQPLRPNALLERSAANHARYLAANHAQGHDERPGRRGFTGAGLKERVRVAGYAGGPLAENVASGSTSARQAVDGLMSAIYHRLGFLDFDLDEVGIGTALPDLQQGQQDQQAVRHVFNLGNGQDALRVYCAQQGQERTDCAGRVRLPEAQYRGLTLALARGNPRLVRWPPPDWADTPPYFSSENPDPLPDVRLSGYPVSIQLNPARVGKARMLEFRLYRVVGAGGPSSEVTHTRLLTQTTDPNRELGPLDFALFPLERLDWDTGYEVLAKLEADGHPETLRWSFRTRRPPYPLYTLAGRGEVLPVRAGADYALYLPPTPGAPLLAHLRQALDAGVQAQVEWIDPNTLHARLAGPLCRGVRISAAGGKFFSLRLAAGDTVFGAQPPEALYAACSEVAADFKIEGRGERLTIVPGRRYLIHLKPSRSAGPGRTPEPERIERVRWQGPQDVDAQLSLHDDAGIAATVRGQPGQQLQVEVSGGRRFALVLAAP